MFSYSSILTDIFQNNEDGFTMRNRISTTVSNKMRKSDVDTMISSVQILLVMAGQPPAHYELQTYRQSIFQLAKSSTTLPIKYRSYIEA